MIQRWLARHGREWAVGLALTALAVGLHLAGLTEPWEWVGFDINVRRFSRTPASDRILHIDIDDDALDRIGSWPWPRDLQAELLRTLKNLGAAQVVTDIVWTEPKPPEVRLPGLERFADLEGMSDRIGEASSENLVFPDDELASAIAQAGNVYLAMYYESEANGQETPPDERRIAEVLHEHFELDAAAVAARTGITRERVEAVLAGIKRRAAEDRVAAILDKNPAASFEQVHQSILTTPLTRQTADRADVLAAYHRVLSLRTLAERCPPVPPGLRGKLHQVSRAIPPVYKFTAGARRVGFVTFRPDRDGRTRRVPLLLEWRGRLLEHLAFAVARDALGIDVDDLAIDERGFLVIRGRNGQPDRRIQLDEDGQLLINWHVARGDWPTCFEHRPVTLLLQLCDCRRRINENNSLRQWKIARVVHLTRDDAGFDLYRRQVERMAELDRKVRWARLQGRGDSAEIAAAADEARRLRLAIQRDQDDAVTMVREEWSELQKQSRPADTRAAEDRERFREANELIAGDIADLDRTNARIEAQYDRLVRQLRPLVEGRICFVGYTATAVADMVTTPAYRHVPGVLVHSNVLNSFLNGRFLSWSAPAVQVAIIVLFGVAVTAMAASRGPWAALLFVLAVAAASILLNGLVIFARADHWLRLVTALLLTFVAWALIVMFRYLTTDRERRRFSRAVAQYVSPAMARQLADRSTNLDMSPADGYVTCFFSDLVGFTPISEKLGPEGTKTLLNPYLHAMSGALHRHQALINKFMGDGIFAFFNPPILPCEGHEIAACEAALDSRGALLDLKRAHADHPLAAEFRQLAMRIGIASGPVFVGDYGSENKLDYTCVGDTVNLAARLESANKALGSGVMLADSTRRVAGDRYLYRRLGAIQVLGRTTAAEVHELLGRPGEVDGQTLGFAEAFERAVDAFARRDFKASTDLFRACLELRPNDAGALCYLQAIQTLAHTPPPESWIPCLELSGK